MMFSRPNPSFFILSGFLVVHVLMLSACQVEQIREATPIGQVSKSVGFPVVNRNNQQYILAPQSTIYASDIFDTDDSSMVQISLHDNTIITAGYKTHFSLHSHDQNRDSFSTSVTLAKGSLRATTSEKGNLELRTPLAVAELQGGDIYVNFGANILEVMLAERGTINIENDDGSITINTPGMGTTVIAGSAPHTPYELSRSKLERALGGITIEQ